MKNDFISDDLILKSTYLQIKYVFVRMLNNKWHFPLLNLQTFGQRFLSFNLL